LPEGSPSTAENSGSCVAEHLKIVLFSTSDAGTRSRMTVASSCHLDDRTILNLLDLVAKGLRREVDTELTNLVNEEAIGMPKL
jgi:hypothetical protein